MVTVLIVDDEPNVLEGVKRLLDWEKLGVGRIWTCLLYTSPLYPGADHKCDSGRPGFRRAVYHEKDRRLCLHSVQRGADCGSGKEALACAGGLCKRGEEPGSGFILLP